MRSLPTTDTQRGYSQDSEASTEKNVLTRCDRRRHAHIPPRLASEPAAAAGVPGLPGRGWAQTDFLWHTAGTRARRLGLPRSAAAALRLRPLALTHLAGLGLPPSVPIRPHRNLGSDRAVPPSGPLTPPGRVARPAPGPPPPAWPASGRGPRLGPQRWREPDTETWRHGERQRGKGIEPETERLTGGEMERHRQRQRKRRVEIQRLGHPAARHHHIPCPSAGAWL